jgi:hypothetical protein
MLNHTPQVSYSPYVDHFQYSCRCFDKENHVAHEVTATIRFYTDKDGNVTLLEVKQLHGSGDGK